MEYLHSPVKAFKNLSKTALLTDAIFVVASIWIVLIGLQIADQAALDALTGSATIRIVAEVTLGVLAVWMSVTGVGYLLQHAARGKAEFVPILVMSALAATPLALLGIAAVVVELFVTLAPLGEELSYVITRSLLWAGVILGAPGVYFGIGLYTLAGLKKSKAALIAVFLTLVVILLVMLRNLFPLAL